MSVSLIDAQREGKWEELEQRMGYADMVSVILSTIHHVTKNDVWPRDDPKHLPRLTEPAVESPRDRRR